ncbi:NfeD family protein [Microbulbifer hydrolyticus]|uniref:Membrane-bound serine protease (ClpP class) n=1 Tax=Microbulbifer hydrolyticus TaxID=48074 RepID=A0A6P1TAE4_9GAMM|nr:nodulation protein NfeD [Microbulbifer hydrolyticus]MBB5212071.1 membrane-bound serine protease (ClpP class) [Microbulbifer hydrolyticus]QHQ39748.1 nodulation protein NfeD [Microbulbifer hydrolyticus]
MDKRLSKGVLTCLLLLLAQLFSVYGFAQETEPGDGEQRPHIAELSINGPIGPATTDYLIRTSEKARAQGARLFILTMDTPGGLDAATRDIIQHILASEIPYVTYVTPAGARAASAGTYILYASQVAAMTPSTTLGAATPVQMGGMPGQGPPAQDETEKKTEGDGKSESKPDEESASKPGTAMERKVINDSVAYIRGLANRHGRNADWAEKAVRDAATLTANEALAENVIDVVADNREQLLKQLPGRQVLLASGKEKIDAQTAELPVVAYAPDWRNELLSLITNPQVAYILLLVGIYGLIFEGYSPGAIVPGVVGVICLLLAFYALQVLPINYAGLALIVVGALLIAAELFVPSFGALGIGGVVALVIGSVMLIDSDVPGMQVSKGLIGGIAGVSGLALLGILYAVGRSLRKPKIAANQAMVGRTAVVTEVEPVLLVKIDGEIWRAKCENLLTEGQLVQVIGEKGLMLQVQPE